MFSSSCGAIIPNMEKVFIMLIIATNDVPKTIASGIFFLGFLTNPAGDVPPSRPTNPQKEIIVALIIF